MKILKSNLLEHFSIVGMTREEFYCIKHALAAYASRAADPDKSQGMADYEIENAIPAWNNFKDAERYQVFVD
jgi:hypothetical protein